MARADWLNERVREFTALRGRTVRTWTGVEMAFFEDPPRFTDPRAPFLQLLSLDATLDGEVLSIVTYQDDDAWGLWTQPPGPSFNGGIYRERHLAELPTGRIDDVTVRIEDGVPAAVHLVIGTRPLLLLAGEAYEDRGDDLYFCRLDESVLAFTDPAAAATVPWRN
ncbi:hypothetical protein [Actinophytocola sp. KF-1]